MKASLTDCGLPGIRDIPYGVHMCHFYERRDELVAALVPYFAAGLRNHERCIWITAEPLDAAAAKAELARTGFDMRDFAEVLDVAQRHSCTLEHPDEGWQIVTAR